MAWDFSTEPEFEAKLQWMREYVREEVMPLDRVRGGLLALLGAFADWETLDADIAEVIAARPSGSGSATAEL